ncbi:uncharacterized protein LY89DRAFT_290280 [Mollisia scopiformis]|uniref:Uncharacterized protein n=1 Tax=Mollisia scopiformis TaxID=149040 RepID=A0A194XQ04_MOLSC|nr:uncharacterized protein LY89DRAFT_290280 [Mollisia scopiformis]KUJ22241.1 hypothetical protein LY89DRAFT_290280 [Mollisia scopiformis]
MTLKGEYQFTLTSNMYIMGRSPSSIPNARSTSIMSVTRTTRILDKVPWVPRSTVAENSQVPLGDGNTSESGSISDKSGRSSSGSDSTSDCHDGCVSVAVFDILWRDDDCIFNQLGGSIRFKILFEQEAPAPRPNITQPLSGRNYISIFEMGMNECIFKCSAFANGMGWENFRAFKRNRAFKSGFPDDEVSFRFPDDMLDDGGVPMLMLILGDGRGCTDQVVVCWAKMRDNAHGNNLATFSSTEIAKISVYEKLDE